MIKEKQENGNMTSTVSIETYNTICNQVFDYMLGFNSDDPSTLHNLSLKREHISRVIGYTEVLTRDLAADNDLMLSAQLTAILHDIGRFEQFTQFKTFNDALSFDHAEKAVQLIEEKGWLNDLGAEIQNMIKKAVLFHNKITIPKGEDAQVVLLSKIIRDADKIDIFDIAVKEFALTNSKKNQFFSYELANKPTFTKNVAKAIIDGRLADKKDLHNINDFKLMIMGFIFDVNFKKSYTIISQRQYLKQLFDTLPKSDEIFEVYRVTKIHVENKLI
jgi:hypothetical protein